MISPVTPPDVPEFPPVLIATWLDSLPPPVESGLRSKLGLDAKCVFGVQYEWMSGAPRGTLRDAVSAFFDQYPGPTAVAVVCALFDVQFYKMDSQDHLDRKHESFLQDLPVFPAEERAQAERILETHPLHSRQWVRAASEWKAMRAGPLSPDSINEAYWFEPPPLRNLLPPRDHE